MKDAVPAFKRTIGPWVLFAFSVVFCGVVMFTWAKTGRIEAAFPAFFCFLPMTFFFVAAMVGPIRKELKGLSDRIDRLEQEKK
jgi:hypothetical protein